MKKTEDQTIFTGLKPSPPRKLRNKDKRSREYLFTHEVEELRKAARNRKGSQKYAHRNDTIILLMYRHALRVSETVMLRWDQIDLTMGAIHVVRTKNGVDCTHPLQGDEIRSLRKLQKQFPNSPFVFLSRKGGPLTANGVHKMIAKAGVDAKMSFTTHPHMLRHATGYYLANKGTDTRSIMAYMGHRDIDNTVVYTNMAPNRFKNFWKG